MRMEGVMDQIHHTTRDRIFGGMMLGDNLRPIGLSEGEYTFTPHRAWNLQSIKPAKQHHVQLVLHTEQKKSLEQWKAELNNRLSQAESKSEAWSKNQLWWI